MVNTPGLIDAGYRGEISVLLINHDPIQAVSLSRGDRIAQLVVLPVTTRGSRWCPRCRVRTVVRVVSGRRVTHRP